MDEICHTKVGGKKQEDEAKGRGWHREAGRMIYYRCVKDL